MKAIYKDNCDTILGNMDCSVFLGGKELKSQDELAVMDGGKCILQLRSVRPFFSDKYDITKHPNYPLTADTDAPD